MSEFRVHQPMNGVSVMDHANTDPSPHRDVRQTFEVLTCAPALLAERGRIDVSVEVNGLVEAKLQGPGQIGVLPPGFRGARYEPKRRRGGLQVERTKRADR